MFKKILGYVLAPLALMFGFVQQVLAALPAGVTAAIDEATTDGVTLGGLMLALAVAVGVIFWLKRKV